MTESFFDYTGKIISDEFKQVYTSCHIVRAVVCYPSVSNEPYTSSSGDQRPLPWWTAPASVKSKPWEIDGQAVELPNPNYYESPQYRLFVAIQGTELTTGKLCRWVVRFRLFDKKAFLKQQDTYQLRSLCAAITGERFGVDHFLNDNVKSNDPLPEIAAVARRLNSCRDAQFTSFGLPKETQPLDPRERKKRFWSWCFSGDSDLTTDYHHSSGYTLWDDGADLTYFEIGAAKPLSKVAQSLTERLRDQVKIELTSGITEETVANDYPIFIGVRTRGYTPFDTPDVLDEIDDYLSQGQYGFDQSLSTALLGWTIRQGFDQLVLPKSDEFGRAMYAGPKFDLYTPDTSYDHSEWESLTHGGFRAKDDLKREDGDGILSGTCALPIFKLPHNENIYKKIDFNAIAKSKKEETQSVEETVHELFDID